MVPTKPIKQPPMKCTHSGTHGSAHSNHHPIVSAAAMNSQYRQSRYKLHRKANRSTTSHLTPSTDEPV